MSTLVFHENRRTMKEFLILALSAILFYSCNKSIRKSNEINSIYFERGDLSQDDENDSIRSYFFTKTLQAMEEPSLRNSNTNSLRVTLLSSFYNPYVIRLERMDSATKVVFKFKGDEENFVRAGLSGLNLTYTSSYGKMDSLVGDLFQSVRKYGIFILDLMKLSLMQQMVLVIYLNVPVMVNIK